MLFGFESCPHRLQIPTRQETSSLNFSAVPVYVFITVVERMKHISAVFQSAVELDKKENKNLNKQRGQKSDVPLQLTSQLFIFTLKKRVKRIICSYPSLCL